MNYNITNLKTSDLKRVGFLIQNLFADPPYCEDWLIKESKRRASEVFDNPQSVCWKLEIDKKLIGFLLSFNVTNYDGIYNYIDYVGIERDEQNKGYGKILFKHHQKYLKNHKVVAMFYYAKPKSKSWKFHTKVVGVRECDWKLVIKKLS